MVLHKALFPIIFEIKYKRKFLLEQRKHLKEDYRLDFTVLNTKFSSVTLNEMAMKTRERIL